MAIDKKFESIGLALSGGGYRAAAFHLGTLGYLNRVGLMDKVNAISTVSGGTFTGTRLVLAQAERIPFQDYYRAFYDDLANIHLVTLAMKNLGKGVSKAPSKRKDLIIAIAQVYADTFLQKGNGDTYLLRDVLEAEETPVKEAAFNATDFRSGLAFRFQKTESGLIGNFYVDLPKEDAGKIRLADVLAASSCFPGGFEPLEFPDDFVWPDGKVPDGIANAVAARGEEPIALMDGGVYDNQGLESLLLAEERKNIDLDLFIISDTDQLKDTLYEWPNDFDTVDIKLSTARMLLSILTWGGLISALTIGARLVDQGLNKKLEIFDWLLVLPLIVTIATAFFLFMGHRKIVAAVNKHLPGGMRGLWEHLKKITIDQVADLLILRGTSLVSMATSVFMYRIRALVYGLIYNDDKYKGQRISNLIYQLTPKYERKEFPGISPPSQALQKVANDAAEMRTILWFETEEQQPKVVAAGQATICYNLMKYVVRNCGEDQKKWSTQIKELWTQLTADWKVFQKNPLAFVDVKHVVPPVESKES